MAVAVGVVDAGHAGVFGGVVQEAGGFGDDAVFGGADQFDRAGFDGFGAFGLGAQDQDGLAERGGLFLDAAGIGDALLDECRQEGG